MKDCEGNRIALGSTLGCVNDVNYGEMYKVVSFVSTLCIIINGVHLPLSSFCVEDGKLIDFKRIGRRRKG